MADAGSMPALMQALGDQTKMVQTSAASAVRMILSRRQDQAPEGRKLLIAALESPNPRQRWGAARVFNQHFRDLTGDKELLAALEKAVDDPVPFVRFEAASGLWRWYYWQVDQPEMRRSTLETLATRMNVETDAMVRRGLQESIYDLLDEKTQATSPPGSGPVPKTKTKTKSGPATNSSPTTRRKSWRRCCAKERRWAAKASSTPCGIFTSATTLSRL